MELKLENASNMKEHVKLQKILYFKSATSGTYDFLSIFILLFHLPAQKYSEFSQISAV